MFITCILYPALNASEKVEVLRDETKNSIMYYTTRGRIIKCSAYHKAEKIYKGYCFDTAASNLYTGEVNTEYFFKLLEKQYQEQTKTKSSSAQTTTKPEENKQEPGSDNKK